MAVYGPFLGLGGLRIQESNLMVEPFEDWSRVRSHARARRRRWKHRQNIRFGSKPRKEIIQFPDGTLVCHPEVARELLKQLGIQLARKAAS